MLTEIKLSPVELEMLTRAASHVGAQLVPDYLGDFRPATPPRCIALCCDSPGQLMQFGGVLTLVLDIGKDLLSQLAARVQEDRRQGPGNIYYWPGILA